MSEEVVAWAEYAGYRFRPPFLCMCCGCEVDVRQWAFGRTCAKCDTGSCQAWHSGFKQEYGHENPPWKRAYPTRAEAIAAFAEHATYDRAPAQIANHATGRTGRAQARSGSADAGETAPFEVGDVGGEGRAAGSGAERSTGGEVR